MEHLSEREKALAKRTTTSISRRSGSLVKTRNIEYIFATEFKKMTGHNYLPADRKERNKLRSILEVIPYSEVLDVTHYVWDNWDRLQAGAPYNSALPTIGLVFSGWFDYFRNKMIKEKGEV